MQGVTFGDLHSKRDFGLLLESKEIGSPTVKTEKIDIPGADGVLDMTDFFGGPKYENVTHKFDFILSDRNSLLSVFTAVKNAIHGKKVRIILDDDPSFFYMGRCFVSSFTSSKGIGTISVECDCEPWKYKAAETVVTKTVSGSARITLNNSRRHVVPKVKITSSGSIRLTYQTVNVWNLAAGEYTLPDLELVEGENIVDASGTGSVTFTWREAAL